MLLQHDQNMPQVPPDHIKYSNVFIEVTFILTDAL